MREIFKSGSVGGVGGNPGSYPELGLAIPLRFIASRLCGTLDRITNVRIGKR
jgi:hypothetical protein